MEQIIIHQVDGTVRPLCDRVNPTSVVSAKQKREIINADTVTIQVQSTNPQVFNIGDWITVFGRVYRLNRLPKVKKTGEFVYIYDLEFEGIQYDLLRVMYNVNVDTTDNTIQDVTGDALTGDLARFMDVLIANANRVFPGVWSVGTMPESTDGDVTLSFGASDNCLAVLQTLCDKFATEFSITTTDGKTFVINMGKVGTVLPYTFLYGHGGGLYEITRQNVSSANIVNRLYVYGSTENITCKYRGTRLLLSGVSKAESYLENADSIKAFGVHEGIKNFDDIKPTYDGIVTAVNASNVLEFTDSNFPFDINELEPDGVTTKYLIDGVSAKIHFNSGNLAGFEFEIAKYDHATKTFTLIKQTDERGNEFPHATSIAFQVAKDNKYKILDVAYPDNITEAAETRLREHGLEYLEQNCQPKVQYSAAVTKMWLMRHSSDAGVTEHFQPGDYLHIVDEGIGVDKSIRIQAVERDILDPYTYNLTISDNVTVSITNRVISDLIDIDKIVTINDLKDPTRARANWRSSREVLNMVFDPEGDYYTDKIKPESIDTTMLSVGAKSMQFGLVGVTIQANYQANPNTIALSGGQLVHYAIADEVMTWNIAAATVSSLAANTAYYIYVKVYRDSDAAEWMISTDKIKYDQNGDSWVFLVGILNSVDTTTNTRSIYTMYGFTTINGRFIRTGRIQSTDGITYFDLDAGEIGGKITFTRADGTTGNVADVETSANESMDYIENTLPGLLAGINTAIDGKIDTWYQEADPSTEWTTNEVRAAHVGDMWYKSSTNELKRYSSTYAWELITDAKAIEAYQVASQAQDTADGKRRVFTSQPSTADAYDIGDLWVNATVGAYIDELLRCCKAKASGEAFSVSHWVAAAKYTDDSSLEDFIENTYNKTIEDLKSQLDGQIEQFFETYDPTLENAPASEWTTTADKEYHLGDLFYNTSNGKVFRFVKENGVYKWQQLQDEELAQALVLAQNAYDLADKKRVIFASQPAPPYDVGDLWVNATVGTYVNEILVCQTARSTGSFVLNDWKKASKYTDDSSLNEFVVGTFAKTIEDLQTQIDGKVETWFTSTDPSTAWTTEATRKAHVGDMWYNTSAKTLWYYNSSYKWKRVTDQDTIDAYDAASKAQDTADGKRRVFTSQPVVPYDVGDLWCEGGTGDILMCITAKTSTQSYNRTDWVNASKYTDDSALDNFIENTYNDEIANLQTQLDGKIESWYQTYDPATSWAKAAKAKHVGDIWYNTNTKKLYIYTKGSSAAVRAIMQNGKMYWETTTSQGNNYITTWTNGGQEMMALHEGDTWLNTSTKTLYRLKANRTTVDGVTTIESIEWVDISTENLVLNHYAVWGLFRNGVHTYTSQPTNYIANDLYFMASGIIKRAIKAMDEEIGYSDDDWYISPDYTDGVYYYWQRQYDQDAIDAHEAAANAQDTADGKRTVFVTQPTASDSYEVGDLWVNASYNANGVVYNNDLLRCVTAKASGVAFSIAHWSLATKYDNTKTTIDGGIVTSGTVQLAGSDATIKAGVTGEGTTDTSIRMWAGNTFQNRGIAPFRVNQAGEVWMTNSHVSGEAHINKGTIENATMENVVINGAFRNAFQDGYFVLGGGGGITVSTPGLQNNNNVVIPGQGGEWVYSIQIPFDLEYNGFRAILMNTYFNGESSTGYFEASAPSGKYFYENGKTFSKLQVLKDEAVEMIGFGDANTFYGWIILRRFYLAPDNMRGVPFHISYMGMVKQDGTLVKVKKYDNANVTVERTAAGRYKITINPGFSSANNYLVFATCDATEAGTKGRFASVYSKSTGSFYIYTGDDNSPNDSGFTFMVVNTTDF